ncbi:putative glycolipid-binding domain-containing protein [Arthrobacter sp. APC 3897]|uniref:putative glycolipid-binding domain-containing protein n=1 Tax=Arthrobacter sp. APC 3897 TaxID=3035204 RepID=UPI0025B5A6F9|nr:putative glycolipid-binding domain-containing protein [Arthrobacter sp. APC 3897]MDN3481930.1 putative glycolipid-binding domain-containing protein [Arthrobacter sp. APC 3897]
MRPARTLRWQGLEDTARHDTAAVSFRDRELAAGGTSVTDEYTASWTLSTSPGWVTTRFSIRVEAPGWSRSLELMRSPEGKWTVDTQVSGNSSLPAPGIEDTRALDNAQDVDLALCPLTNTMPILRLDLLNASAPADDTKLTAAWVEMPSLRVLPSKQVYSQVSAYDEDRGYGVVLYSSTSRGFTAELTVDADGAVLDYPGMAARLP